MSEQSGGSAEVFRTIGEKWRCLPESTKDSFRKRAAVSGCVSLPSPSNVCPTHMQYHRKNKC